FRLLWNPGDRLSAHAETVSLRRAQLRGRYHFVDGVDPDCVPADIDQKPAFDDEDAAPPAADDAAAREVQGQQRAVAEGDGGPLQAQSRQPAGRVRADGAAVADFHRAVRGAAELDRAASRAVCRLDQ